jgi:CRP-like cAMP-binding protein
MAFAATEAHPTRYLALLDIEPELGADLPPDERVKAQKLAVAPAVEVPSGEVDLEAVVDVPSRRGTAFALMVAEGVLIRDVLLGGRVATQLLGPGDIVDLRGEGESSLPTGMRLTAAEGARVALLDDRFLAASRRWPWLAGRLIERTGRQVERGAVQQAISQLGRVELRLLGLMWHLADRFGMMTRDGVIIRLDLTHEALGRLAGAARPTVTLALKVLAADGHLVRRADSSWLLDPESIALLGEVPSQALPAVRVGSTLAPAGPTMSTPAPEAHELVVNFEPVKQRLERLRVQVGTTLQRSAELQAETLARRQGSRGTRFQVAQDPRSRQGEPA